MVKRVVCAIGIVAIALAILAWLEPYPPPWRREMVIDRERETVEGLIAEALRNYRARTGTYTDGSGECPGAATYEGQGTAIPDLSIAVQGTHYLYRVQAVDRDSDGACEAYAVSGYRLPDEFRE